MKRNLKWILSAGIVLLVLICILPLPVKISTVQNAVIWEGGDETAVMTCTITIAGTYKRCLLRTDTFEGRITISADVGFGQRDVELDMSDTGLNCPVGSIVVYDAASNSSLYLGELSVKGNFESVLLRSRDGWYLSAPATTWTEALEVGYALLADNYNFAGDTGEVTTEEIAAETENVTAEEDSASEIGQTVSDGVAGDTSAAGSSTPDFTTNCIRIYTAADNFASVMEITDTGEIAKIVTTIDVSSWEEATLETELAEEPYYYIDFGTGTVISLAAGIGYGSVGTAFYASYDAAGNLTAFTLENAMGPYYFHDDLYAVISELMSG